MSEVLKKLKLANQNPVLILNAPEEYKDVMEEITQEVHTSIKGKYKFIQVFVKSIGEAELCAKDVTEALDGDGYLWICYPKGTSKKYKADINRDKAREVYAPYEFEGVALVAVDNDWSAIRLRHIDNIKKITGKSAVTEKGKERAINNKR